MSDSVTVENDNINPDVDNLTSLTTETNTIICEADLDDDFFVCRKCNRVFKDLSEYLEHKIRDENYKLSHTRSKASKRMVIPQLVEKKKAAAKTKVRKNVNVQEVSSIQPDGLAVTEINEKSEGVVDGSLVDTGHGPSAIRKGKKKKAETQVMEELPSSEKDNKCHLCDRKFRRAATLRWHVKYDHKEKDEDDSEDSDTSLNELASVELDGDFIPNAEHKNEDEKDDEVPEITPAVRQPKVTVFSAARNSSQDAKDDGLNTDAGDKRPYVCDVCGRGFKELPVYKAHAIVHSKERNFVCTWEGCPYGFKTKGCLVRHMRRHTGERPYSCEKCGRAFAESGALNRHMKARRNCAQTPDTHYPRYKKKWSYHPNIEAVVDQTQRDVQLENHQDPLNVDDTNIFIESVELAEVVDDKGNPTTLVVNADDTEGSGVVTAEIISINQWPVTTVKHESADKSFTTTLPSISNNSGIKQVHTEKALEFLAKTHCQVCSKEFQQIEHLEAHLHTHLADQPKQCGLCHFLAQNREEMRQHVLTTHCDSLNDIESAIFAMEQTDPNKNAAQQKDERILLREALLAIKQLQRLKVLTEKGFKPALNPSTTGSMQCMICHRTFKGVHYMRQHMRMHTGDRPFKCSQCNRSFASKDVLKKHLYVHINQRDYKCGECGKMFKRLVHVQQHIKTHTQDRSYRCTVCDKLFKTSNSLKVHLRTHTNVNPYRCHVCNRHFRERGSLQRHMRLHTGERPYVCPHCNRGFAEQGTLSRHLKAKVPCSSTRDSNIQLGAHNSNTMLAQFSSMVADTQYILPAVNNEELTGGNLMVLKTGNDESGEVIENIEVVTEEAASLEDNKLQEETLIANESIEQMMEENNTETLQVYDPSTGEALIITGDKSVMEMVKSQQVALESMNGELSLDKIRDILMAAGESQNESFIVGEDDKTNIIISEELVQTDEIQEFVDDKLEIEIGVDESEESQASVQVADLGTEVITALSSQQGSEM